MNSKYTAGPQALGYLYQVRLALYLLLQERAEKQISIELLDDVAFEQDGNPAELLQIKHHTKHQGSLSDSSADLWKTIRVWCEEANFQFLESGELTLTLISTSQAPKNSIANILKPGNNRNFELAWKKLVQFAKSSTNKNLKSSFKAFLELSDQQQEILVKAINILDMAPNIQEIESKIHGLLLGIRPEHRGSALEQIEGWWFRKAINHLIENTNKTDKTDSMISKEEVELTIARVSDQYGPDVLPIHFRDEKPNIPPDAANRLFVEQLRLIDLDIQMVEQAILDYYRAFEQRSRWVRLNLLEDDDELTKYEDKLIEEWKIFSWKCKERLNKEPTDYELKKCGRDILSYMYDMNYIPLRPKITEPYVMRGSYHMLADNLNGGLPRVGWHPLFLQKLEEVFAS